MPNDTNELGLSALEALKGPKREREANRTRPFVLVRLFLFTLCSWSLASRHLNPRAQFIAHLACMHACIQASSRHNQVSFLV